jgi:hypothetical protein
MKSINPKEMSNENTILISKNKDYPKEYIDFLSYELATRDDDHQESLDQFFGRVGK